MIFKGKKFGVRLDGAWNSSLHQTLDGTEQ